MGDNIFDIITDYSVNEGINKILLEDEEHAEIQKEIDEHIEKCEKLGLTKEQRLAEKQKTGISAILLINIILIF